jgi:hypothetical protein
MIEVAKAGATIAACPHSLTVEKLSMIRHHFKRAAGGWQYHVAIACRDCEVKIPYLVGGNEAIDAAVERVCHRQIKLNWDLYLLSDGTIVTVHDFSQENTYSADPDAAVRQRVPTPGADELSPKEVSR